MEVTVVIAESEPLFARGLRHALSQRQSIEVVGETGSGDEALRLVERRRPTVLLLGAGIADLPPFVLASQIREHHCDTRVVAVGPPDRDLVVAMVAAGAAGYLARDETAGHLVRAVEAVARGDTWYSLAAGQAITRPGEWDVAEPGLLTRRERQVLALVAGGKGNDGIARSLGVSTPTVRFHLRNLYRKLGPSGRAELVAWAVRAGGDREPGEASAAGTEGRAVRPRET